MVINTRLSRIIMITIQSQKHFPQAPAYRMEETQHQNPDIPDGNAFFTCKICVEKLSLERRFNGCSLHPNCTDCVIKYIETQVIDRNNSEITCPDTNCNVKLDPSSCRSVLPQRVFERWCRALCESAAFLDASKGGLAYGRSYCPNRNCSELVLNECVKNSLWSTKITKSSCPSCKNLFRFRCMVPWEEKHQCIRHGKTIIGNESADDDLFMKIVKQKGWRRCPSCHYYVEHNEGCKTITWRCSTIFCYSCGSSSCVCHERRPIILFGSTIVLFCIFLEVYLVILFVKICIYLCIG